jgi:hypothetical protein
MKACLGMEENTHWFSCIWVVVLVVSAYLHWNSAAVQGDVVFGQGIYIARK